MGRSDFKQRKELEELRKLGAAPAEVDKDGNMINPHMPQYMTKQPWYLDSGAPGLQHHLLQNARVKGPEFHEFTRTGVKKGATRLKKWKTGACANCGAATHKTHECVYRPRRRKAKVTNKDMMPEEYVLKPTIETWDTKRDRWKGFDVDHHQADVTDRYNKINELRKKKRAEEFEQRIREGDEKTKKKFKKKLRKLKGAALAGVSSDSSDSDSDDDDDSEDELKDGGEIITISTARQTVRNLRLREDLPKYLMNLDPESAFYDPKSRAMHANPFGDNPNKDAASTYHGDNFERYDGESQEYFAQRRFAGLTREHIGEDASGAVHQASNPTMAEKVFKQQHMKRSDIKGKFDDKILSRYGGQEHLERPEYKTSAKEVYREYAADGRVTKGPKLVSVQSKYVEDEHPGNHTSVWGSWYDRATRKWGFACCRQTIRRSYCTGASQSKAKVAGPVQPGKHTRKRKAIGAQKPPSGFWQNERTEAGYTKVKGLMAGFADKRRKLDSQEGRGSSVR